MLVTSIVAFVLFLGALFLVRPMVLILEASGLEPPPITPSLGREAVPALAPELLASQMSKLGLVPLKLLAAVLILASLIYLIHPLWQQWRLGGRRLAADEAPGLLGYLRRLASEAGLPRPITVSCKPNGFALDGTSFGSRGRERIHLPLDPRFLQEEPSPALRAIALHELAHLVHGDVPERERARALWLSLGVLMTAITAVGLAARADLSVSLLGGGSMAFFALTVHLMYRGFVRTREYYADWRVVAWGHGEELRAVLEAGHSADLPPWWRRAILRPLSTHPTPRDRLATMKSHLRLFEASDGLAALTGGLLALLSFYGLVASAGFAIPLLSAIYWLDSFAQQFLPTLGASSHAADAGGALLSRLALPFITTCAFLLGLAHFTTRSLGVQVQRAAIAHLAEPDAAEVAPRRLVRTSVSFTLGYAVGYGFTPFFNLRFLTVESTMRLLPWHAAFALVVLGWLGFLYFGSKTFLGWHRGSLPPRRRQQALTAAGTLLLTFSLLPLAAWRLGLLALDVLQVHPPSASPASPLIVMSCFTLLSQGCGLALLPAAVVVALSMLAYSALRSFQAEEPCTSCGHRVGSGPAVGRECPSCSRSLAPWAYLDGGSSPPASCSSSQSRSASFTSPPTVSSSQSR